MDYNLFLRSVGYTVLFSSVIYFCFLFLCFNGMELNTIKSRLCAWCTLCLLSGVWGVLSTLLFSAMCRDALIKNTFMGIVVLGCAVSLLWPFKLDPEKVRKKEEEDREYAKREAQGRNYRM